MCLPKQKRKDLCVCPIRKGEHAGSPLQKDDTEHAGSPRQNQEKGEQIMLANGRPNKSWRNE